MKWITAKIGTHSQTRILHTKGRLRVGGVIEWKEAGDSRWTPAHYGRVAAVEDWGLVRIDL